MRKWNFFMIYILIISTQQNIAFLNDAEQEISAGLMESLRTSHRILLEEPNSNLKNLKTFKSPIFRKKASAYQNTNQILKYFRKENFPASATLIVFKVDKIKPLINFLKILKKKKKSHIISKFKWVVFVGEYNEKDANELLVPFDSEFVVAYPNNSTSYKLVEVYKIKAKTATFDFGFRNEEKLEVTKFRWYRRRQDFKNETLVMFSMGKETAERPFECIHKVTCAYFNYLEVMATTMNFRLKWLEFGNFVDLQKNYEKLDLFAYGASPTISFIPTNYLTLTSQVFKCRLNWYIREPVKEKRADYYMQPFDKKIWIFLLLTLIVGSFTTIFIGSFLNTKTDTKKRKFSPKDYLLMPADYICNQESARPEATIPSRVASFSIRFLCLFIFGSYSATITSFSAVHIIRPPFRNLDEFIRNGKYTVSFLADWAELPEEFMTLKSKAIFTNNITEHTETLCKENFAIAAPENDIEDPIIRSQIHCQYYQIENPIVSIEGMTGLVKSSPFKKIINFFLINFHSSGVRQLISKRFFESSVNKKETVDFDYVEFKQIVQILGILAIGVLLSVVILINEMVFPVLTLKIKNSGVNKIGKKTQNRGKSTVFEKLKSESEPINFMTQNRLKHEPLKLLYFETEFKPKLEPSSLIRFEKT